MAYPERKRTIYHYQTLLSALAVLCIIFFCISTGTSSSPPNMVSIKTPITVLSLSQNRTIARSIGAHILASGYHLGGVLASDPFSADELALVLRVLEPPPRAIVMGRGYSDGEADEARSILSAFAQDTGVATGVVVKISDEVFRKVGGEGIPEWVLQQLQIYVGDNGENGDK